MNIGLDVYTRPFAARRLWHYYYNEFHWDEKKLRERADRDRKVRAKYRELLK